MAKKNNSQNTNQAISNTFISGLNKDTDPSFIKKGQWTHARNAVNNTSEGNLGTLSNESSNFLCVEVGKNLGISGSPVEIIGAIHLFSDKWAIFSSVVPNPLVTGAQHEIGLFEEDTCKYRIIVQDDCLNFDRYNLITGAAREKEDCSWGVYWSDSNNPDRYLNIGDPQTWPGNDFVWATNNQYSNGTETIQWPGVQWIEECQVDALGCNICVDLQDLDCEAIRLARLVDSPCLTVERGTQGGLLRNGSYFAVIAYTIKGVKVTDYFSPSNVQPIWHKDDVNGGLKINIEADTEHFDEFQLVVIQNINQGAVAKKIGIYSTQTSTVYLDQIKEDLPAIPLKLIPIQNPVYEKSDEIVEINKYLLRVGPTSKFDFNYQPLANLIKSKWVSVEYPADYYRKGGYKPSYLRDENYAFFIRWVYNTGDKSASYHIPGRAPKIYGATGLFENNLFTSNDSLADDTKLFETINTATPGAVVGTTLPDGGLVLRTGEMGYWESTEIYPDNRPDIWNSSYHCWTGVPVDPATSLPASSPNYDLCGLPIRHHKFPEASSDPSGDVDHYTFDNTNGGAKIRILGAVFENIIYPKDNEGNDIPGLVGYEILRGSREGNKTIIAKGMLNNLRTYRLPGNSNAIVKGLYPNHPFNTIRPGGLNDINDGSGAPFPAETNDPYIRATDDAGVTVNLSIADVPEDILTFHSPDTEFKNPFLSIKELKVYGNLQGTSTQQFIQPEKHPEVKLIRDVVLVCALIGGIIEMIISQLGERTISAPGASFTRIFETDYTQDAIGGGLSGLFESTGVGPLTVNATNVTASNNSGLSGETELIDIPDETGDDATFIEAENAWSDAYDAYFADGTSLNEAMADVGGLLGGLFNLGGSPTPLYETYDQFNVDGGFLAGGTYTAPSYNTKLSRYQQIKNSNANQGVLQGLTAAFGGLGDMLYWFSEGSDLVLRLVYALVPRRQYALQMIAHGFYDTFNRSTNLVNPTTPFIRRFNTEDSFYLGQTIQEMDSYISGGLPTTYRINNLKRSETVVLRTSETTLRTPGGPRHLSGDDSLVTLGTLYDTNSDFKEDNVVREFERNIQSYYGGLKVRIGNQYGQLDNIKQIPIGTCEERIEYDNIPITTLPPVCNIQYEHKVIQSTPILFGGDTYINRYTEKNTMFMFHDWMYDFPPGFEYNYLLRRMLPSPRFWFNSQRYESNAIFENFLDFLNPFSSSNTGEGFLPHEYYNLDWRNYHYDETNSNATIPAPNPFLPAIPPANNILGSMYNTLNGIFSVKKAYMYLSTSGVKDFFVESDVIVDFREQGNEIYEKHYDKGTYTDLFEMFRMDPDIITQGNYNAYDYSLSISKLFTQYFSQGNLQNRNYNPEVAELCYTYYPDRILYSLPQELESIKDSWFMYLPLNYKEFKNQVSSVKNFAKTGIFITFKNASPMVYQGVDTLQTDLGTKITLGDGGLFKQEAQNIVVSDQEYEYGSSQNRLSVITTPAGMYYISQNQGKIFSYAQGLNEISSTGLKWWFNKFLPYALIEDFPDYPHTDNPVAGIACHSIYDNKNSMLYFAKKDYRLKDDFKDRVIYDPDLNLFIIDGVVRTDLDDTNIFEDVSWTVSYDPKSKFWVSHHDWHPNFMIGSKGNFLTIKGSGIWKHNDVCNDYCNYYGLDYPFEVELPIVTGQTVTTMKSIEYILECYKRNEYNCVDQFLVLDYNFDRAVIHNSEQTSGYLNLNPYPKNNVPLNLTYPIINSDSIDILCSKEENKYRFNQFWDTTANRGEFPIGSLSPTTNPVIPGTTIQFGGKEDRHIWNTQFNGYTKTLNTLNLNYTKDPLQRKKFRHYSNLLFLKRNVSGDTNMVLKITNSKNQISPR